MTKPGTSSLKGSVPQNIRSLMICISLAFPMKGGIEKKKSNLQTLSLFISRETYIYIWGQAWNWHSESQYEASTMVIWFRRERLWGLCVSWLLVEPGGSDQISTARTSPWTLRYQGSIDQGNKTPGSALTLNFLKWSWEDRDNGAPVFSPSADGWSQRKESYKLKERWERPPSSSHFIPPIPHPKSFSSWAKPHSWWEDFLLYMLGSMKGATCPSIALSKRQSVQQALSEDWFMVHLKSPWYSKRQSEEPLRLRAFNNKCRGRERDIRFERPWMAAKAASCGSLYFEGITKGSESLTWSSLVNLGIIRLQRIDWY